MRSLTFLRRESTRAYSVLCRSCSRWIVVRCRFCRLFLVQRICRLQCFRFLLVFLDACARACCSPLLVRQHWWIRRSHWNETSGVISNFETISLFRSNDKRTLPVFFREQSTRSNGGSKTLSRRWLSLQTHEELGMWNVSFGTLIGRI